MYKFIYFVIHYSYFIPKSVEKKIFSKVLTNVPGDPRVHFKPRGIYHVAQGDKVTVECFGYGYPIPNLTLALPNLFNTSSDGFKLFAKVGYVKLEFYAMKEIDGIFTCNGINTLGERKDSVKIVGK